MSHLSISCSAFRSRTLFGPRFRWRRIAMAYGRRMRRTIVDTYFRDSVTMTNWPLYCASSVKTSKARSVTRPVDGLADGFKACCLCLGTLDTLDESSRDGIFQDAVDASPTWHQLRKRRHLRPRRSITFCLLDIAPLQITTDGIDD